MSDQAKIATAVSEVASWARGDGGSIRFSVVHRETRQGLECACVGPEWPELPTGRASLVGDRTLVAGAAQLMDDFAVSLSDDGQNKQATVVMTKWLN